MTTARHLTKMQYEAMEEVQTRHLPEQLALQKTGDAPKLKCLADIMSDDPTAKAFNLKFEFDGEYITIVM